MLAVAENPRAVIGGNSPPKPTPFEAVKVNIDDLFDEAKNWLDGGVIASQAEADGVQRIMREMQEAEAAADAQRVRENEPFDSGKRAVQERYAPLIGNTKAVKGKTVLVVEGCRSALGKWLAKVRAEQEAEAAKRRAEADRKAAEAAEAIRAAREHDDLAAVQEAEEAATEATQAATVAKRAENAKAHATGYGRAATLVNRWRPELTDAREALKHYMAQRPDDLKAFLLGLAKADVLEGKRSIPGFTVINEPVAR